MERPSQHHLNENTALLLGRVAHIEDVLDILELETLQLLQDIQTANSTHISDQTQ